MALIFSASRNSVLSEKLYKRIKQDLNDGQNVVLVVPAQSTLTSEKKAFGVLNAEGFFRLRIIRGQKLYEEVLRQTGFPKLISINSIGRNMLLRRISSENRDVLGAFSGIAEENGFLDMAGDFILQLKQNKIDKTEYDELISSAKEGSLLKQKLEDMKLISDKYNQAMLGKFTDSEDLLSFVTGKLKDSSLVSDSKFYYSGFYSFTSNEIAFLSELDRCSKGVCISLLSGRSEHFSSTRSTISRLKRSLDECIVENDEEDDTYEIIGVSAENIHIVRCAGPFTQAQSIASEIKRLVREKSYSYGDIAVLTGNSSSMQGIIKRVFLTYEIPVFADEKRSVLHNKGAEAILSLLDIVCGNFRTLDVIRFCKTDALAINSDELDLFSSYLKQYHIKGDMFNAPFKYGKEKYGYDFERIEKIRALLSALLCPFALEFSALETVQQKTRCLYLFLEEKLHFSEMLEEKCVCLAEEGFLDAAEEYSQVWDASMSLFDQLVELIGESEIDNQAFRQIVSSSFSDIKVGVLPQAEGKVSLGLVSRSLPENVKALFIAGFNDGIIPSSCENMGILTQQELDFAKTKGCILSKPSDVLMDEELFSLYRSLDSAEEYLWLGYCVSDSEGNDLKQSCILSEIRKQFPEIKEESDIANRNDKAAFLEGREMAKDALSESLRNAMYGEELPELWKETFNCIKDDVPCVVEGLNYKNTHKPIGTDIARKLFTAEGDYSLSPSRMDGFAACPFKHYVHYGLMPDEPREFAVGGSEVGTVYHEALLRLCSRVKDWNRVSKDELEQLLDEILKELSVELLDGIFVMGKSQIYTSGRIKQVCLKFALHMAEQIRSSSIDKMFLETGFGRGKIFPAVEISTAAGKVYVEGRIDRVDVCRKDDGTYIRIIDYKSGNTKFDKKLIEKGLSLQLMVYLEGAMGNYPAGCEGGIYYFNIKEPQIASDIESIPAEEIAQSVLEKINKEYKLSGMDVDREFIESFTNILSDLCEKLALGNINATPKKIGSSFDSCAYCQYSSICQKDIN